MLKTETVQLADVQAARQRIQPYVRRTPTLAATALKNKAFDGDLFLKLECLQVSGSFKARGAVNKLRSLPLEALERGIVTASGGNHGLAVAYAGWLSQRPATVFLPHGTAPSKAEKLRHWGATVIFAGKVWDDANAAALELQARDKLTYIHPFADSDVIAGQGTIALEIFDDLPDVDTILVAIGGGGLASGIGVATKALKPNVRLIGIEPVGAPTLKRSLDAGYLVELEQVTTVAGTLAPRRSSLLNLELVRQTVDEIILVTDQEMLEASRWLWFEMDVAAELSGSAAMAALLSSKYQPQPDERVCVLVCGAGADGVSP